MVNTKIFRIIKIASILLMLYYVQQLIYERIEHQRQSNDEDYENSILNKVARNEIKLSNIQTREAVNHTIQHEDLNSHVYLDRYKTHFCLIKKNMLTAMMAVLCYIDDPAKYVQLFERDAWIGGLIDSNCSRSILLGSLKTSYLNATLDLDFWKNVWLVSNVIRYVLQNTPYRHYVIVRHPLKRFVSTFLNCCSGSPELCNRCLNRLDCFLPFLYDHIRNLSLGAKVTRWQWEEHFYPQYWNCYFDRYWSQFRFLYYDRNDRFFNNLTKTLREMNVEEGMIANVNKVLRSKDTAHATYDRGEMIEREIRNDPILLDYVYKIYYVDFVRFNYTIES